MGARDLKAPKVINITAIMTFDTFDSLLVVDAGSDGFRVQDSSGDIIVWPSGTPLSIGSQGGKASGPITIIAPVTGSLNASAIWYD